MRSSSNFPSACLVVLSASLLAYGQVRSASRKLLRLVADQNYPPLSYLQADVVKGMDVDIATALTKAMGRDIQLELMDWDLAQDKVLNGETDGLLSISVSGWTH